MDNQQENGIEEPAVARPVENGNVEDIVEEALIEGGAEGPVEAPVVPRLGPIWGVQVAEEPARLNGFLNMLDEIRDRWAQELLRRRRIQNGRRRPNEGNDDSN